MNKKKIIISISIVTIVSLGVVITTESHCKNIVVQAMKKIHIVDEAPVVKGKQGTDSEAVKSVGEKNRKKEDIKSNILLVNKKNPIGEDYIPENLVNPNIPFASVADPMVEYTTKDVAMALENMFADAKKEGVTLLGVSAYRSYNYQERVFNDSVKTYGLEHSKKYVATPGTSEHQTGLCIDVLSNEYSDLDEGFENTKAFKWLMKNMKNYGFILRYPKGKEDITGYNYESWHIRYVGVEAAKEISNNDITLEEYIEK